MIYHVWKDQVRRTIFYTLSNVFQDWKGSAKTRPLVLAIRDYFVERDEHSRLTPLVDKCVRKQPISTMIPIVEEENDDDPEANIDVPLPDGWVTGYLQVNRLRYVQCRLITQSSLPL